MLKKNKHLLLMRNIRNVGLKWSTRVPNQINQYQRSWKCSNRTQPKGRCKIENSVRYTSVSVLELKKTQTIIELSFLLFNLFSDMIQRCKFHSCLSFSVFNVNTEVSEMTIQERPDKKRKTAFGLAYLIDENPPWYICLLLGFQHYLTMLGGTLAIPFVLSGPMCFANNTLVISEILSTTFFVSSIATLLQTTFGVRLPIVQGGDFAYIAPTFAILSLPKWECPKLPEVNGNSTESSLIHDGEIWKSRMREIQGAIMVSSLFQFVLGITGLVGIFLRYIGPLSIAPTITLLGVGLVVEGAERAGNHWGISMTTIALIALFSQHLSNVKVPVPGYNKQKGGWYLGRYPVFRLFPVILAVVITWIICAIVTAAGGFPSDPSVPQYLARTDARTSVLKEAKWFRIPYPGQWGTPTVSFAGVFGILAGVLSVSVIESVGDYYACARLSGAPPPPIHAVNRGIWIEAIACLFAGAIGSGNGTTSYSQNIAAIGLTKVGSLRVIQWGALVLMVVGVLGKFGALFVTIPDPIIGGVLVVMFGMIAAVGISNLQFADMNSSRNLFVVGFSLVFGLSFPYYMSAHPNTINTGVKEIDQVITVVLSTNTALGCITALILDNTIPGTDEERGITAWRENLADKNSQLQTASIEVYDLPFCFKRLSHYKVAKYLPFLPYKGEVKLACNGEELQNGVLCNSEEHQNGVLCTRAETIGV